MATTLYQEIAEHAATLDELTVLINTTEDDAQRDRYMQEWGVVFDALYALEQEVGRI